MSVNVFSLPRSVATTRLHRARRMLRKRLEQGYRILLDERAEVQCDRKN